MKYEWLLTLIMGALIGYCTNWLAIKMLFRPYTEKRIFGIRVPFTPGVIPKERGRMASKIGEVIEEYLLTDDLIVEELLSVSMQESVSELIQKGLFNESGHISLSFMGDVLITNEELTRSVEKQLTNMTKEMLSRNEIKEVVITHMTTLVCEKLKQVDLDTAINQKSLQSEVSALVTSENTEILIKRYLNDLLDEDKALKQMVPESLQVLAKQSIQFNTLNIIDTIKRTLHKPELESYMITMIEQVISEKLGGLGAMFVNGPDLYQTIIEKAEQQLDDQDIQKQLMGFILEKTDELLEKQLYEVMASHMKEQAVNQICSQLQRAVSESTLLEDMLNLQDETLYTILDRFSESSIKKTVEEYIGTSYEHFLSANIFSEIVGKGMVAFSSYVKESEIVVTETAREKLVKVFKDWYVRLVQGSAKDLLGAISIGGIIEKEINGFDTKMIEEIILDVAKNELTAITRLGALLGFVLAGIILLF